MDRNNPLSQWRKPLAFIVLGVALCLAVSRPAPAQVLGRLPTALPGVPLPGSVGSLAGGVTDRVSDRVSGHLDAVNRLLRSNPRQLERGERGEVAVRAEILALAPAEATLAAARAAGFTVIADTADAELGLRLVTLRPPGRQSIRQALKRLRDLDPDGAYDLNHIFTPGASATGTMLPAPGTATGAIPAARIGLVDGGVATGHPALAAALVTTRGFAGAMTPGVHGTAIASLLVGNAAEPGFAAAAPGAQLFAADVYGSGPTGGNARAIVAALGWLAAQQPGVVNISLVGPDNMALRAGIEALRARGTLVVAAVGNDGPAGVPRYPAAYADVIAVTGLDRGGRLLPEAGRAAHVEFSAPGTARAADPAGGFRPVRGTSFAAPIVTGHLAHALPVADPGTAAKLMTAAGAGPR